MRSLFDTSRDEGYEEGRAEGRAEGELSKAISIARNLRNLGLSTDQIIASTGLTAEQLKNL